MTYDYDDTPGLEHRAPRKQLPEEPTVPDDASVSDRAPASGGRDPWPGPVAGTCGRPGTALERSVFRLSRRLVPLDR